jgi:N-acetylmuramoyl-L-alanine amidase
MKVDNSVSSWRWIVAVAAALSLLATLLQPDRAHAAGSYIVEYGDTLSHIADAYGTTVEALVAANNIRNPDLIVTGQVLSISNGRPLYGGPSGEPATVTQPASYVEPSYGDPDSYPPYFDRWIVEDLLTDAAHRYGWNPSFIKAIAWQESYWRQDEVSWTGAIGVMQVMPETARGMVDWYFGHDMNIWYSAYDNIEMGVAFLTVLYEETGSVELALASYYQGWGSVQKDGFFPDTREYVDRIMMFRDVFQAGNLP